MRKQRRSGPDVVCLAFLAGWLASALDFYFVVVDASANFVGAMDVAVPQAAQEVC